MGKVCRFILLHYLVTTKAKTVHIPQHAELEAHKNLLFKGFFGKKQNNDHHSSIKDYFMSTIQFSKIPFYLCLYLTGPFLIRPFLDDDLVLDLVAAGDVDLRLLDPDLK